MTNLLILCYHAVSESWPTDLAITPERLDAQLRYLLRWGYRPMTLGEALRSPERRALVVSFDDAYRSVLDCALPVLRTLGVPATVFVPTAFVAGEEGMTWASLAKWTGTPHEHELDCLSWDELCKLTAAGWEVGSHSHTHRNLVDLDEAALDEELSRSRSLCEEHLQRPCLSLAYPFGAHNARVRERAQVAGYECGVILERELAIPPWSLRTNRAGLDPLGLFRVGIYRRDGWVRFAGKTSPVVQRVRSSRLLARALRKR